MQVNRIQINSFGKLNNLDLEFDNGINVVNGKNEAGKSTLADYVRCVFYGVNKNKNGKQYSDFEKYSPWNNQKFAGSITYENEGETYNLYRDFLKNKATLTNMYGEDITASYDVAKNKGAEIGLEQFKMDEETFENSILVRQNQVQVDASSQNSIIQKIGNVIQTGDESLSYEEINKKLEKILNDEVGTDRTTTKPKYILKKEVARLEEKQKELESINDRNLQIVKNKELLDVSLSKMNKEYKNLTAIYNVKKKYEDQIKEEKLINDIEYKNKLDSQREREKKRRIVKIAITVMAIALLAICIAVTLLLSINWLWIISGFIVIATTLYILLSAHKKEEKVENNFFEKEKELLQNESNELKTLVEKIKIKKSITEKSSLELSNLMSDLEKEIKNHELESHKLKIEEDAIKDKANNFNEVVEDLEYNKEALNKVLEKEEVINLGIDILHDSYEEIKKKIIPSIEEDIKYTVSKTTNGKYTELKYNDKDGLVCKNEYGELTPLNKLSLGTIDQMYLGFRMAIADKYSNLPLIFDETFVYFDDERLENIIKTLSEIANEKQIIILSCSDREKNILDKLKVKYKKINI